MDPHVSDGINRSPLGSFESIITTHYKQERTEAEVLGMCGKLGMTSLSVSETDTVYDRSVLPLEWGE